MVTKDSEALARVCKWDDDQLKVGLEILSWHESFKTKDFEEANTRQKSSVIKEGKKFLMSQDLFARFTKVPKSLMVEKSPEILEGINERIFFLICNR